MSIRTAVATELRRLAHQLHPDVAGVDHHGNAIRTADLRPLLDTLRPVERRPWSALTVCERAQRVGRHVHVLRLTRGWTTADVAEHCSSPSYKPTAQDIHDLRYGMRHLRGDTELAALAAGLRVDVSALTAPEQP
ncbi:hypothetical protein [Kineococcus radiotolerans]|uniref:Uncharacterized protein n=1 Tax=Kineococcus radiotolerans (strain ATCC BAA-149 / DSM 14245 / SRS30216) TaxID=266940 RepID=A6W8W2_KINRD|nr:hypothetical protein [Kineococcus radiotolerans]ABS03251.1 hypothetical protein Krad_1765 [Kineococcus radiotolerans SRS30216 = ATCC BAA-149]